MMPRDQEMWPPVLFTEAYSPCTATQASKTKCSPPNEVLLYIKSYAQTIHLTIWTQGSTVTSPVSHGANLNEILSKVHLHGVRKAMPYWEIHSRIIASKSIFKSYGTTAHVSHPHSIQDQISVKFIQFYFRKFLRLGFLSSNVIQRYTNSLISYSELMSFNFSYQHLTTWKGNFQVAILSPCQGGPKHTIMWWYHNKDYNNWHKNFFNAK